MENQEQSPIVFISYSWDDEEHKKWVLNLANRLYYDNVDVLLDRYDLLAGKDFIHYMEKSVKVANKVLLILTPNYKVKAEKRIGGVGYEVSIVTANIFKEQDTDKFIPIIRGNNEECVPSFLASRLYIDMNDDKVFEEKYTELKDAIFGNTKRPPRRILENKNEIDDLTPYITYQGDYIPPIERKKYSLSKMVQMEQMKHDFLKVIELKLELAKICQAQIGKESDVYMLEEGIRKAYIALSIEDKKKAKKLICNYNQDMGLYIDQDIQRYLK